MIDRLMDETEMVERHLAVLERVIEEEPIGIVSLADELEYPNHKIRYSLRQLENEDVIEPSDQGAITTERTEAFIEDHRERVEALIERLEDIPEGELSA